ncbi:MAG TPA: membrane dipeptidase [Candidatus Limnocylindrales bacterium]|nr:membrane dipeptidase [Candidatus Limnocylindrales bacterium]
MLLFDAHLDLAMNAMEWNRDLTQPLECIRARESALTDKPDRGRGTVAFPELRHGGIGLCVATQIARFVKPSNPLPGWHSPEQAWAHTQGQLAWYRAMEADGELAQIMSLAGLTRHLDHWVNHPKTQSGDASMASANGQAPIGYILSLEGADSLVSLHYLEIAYGQGLRALGPAHYGPGTYAQGTNASGGLGVKGKELLREMARLGIILDVTHLCDESFWEAMDVFHGRVWASHSNCRALVPHHRQLADDQIKHLIGRGSIIGCALDAWMLVPDWVRGKSTPAAVGLKLEHVVEHIDHICQIAGNARHVGLGTDLDGGFGREQTAADLDTIADLARIPELLKSRGYDERDVQQIAHGNFIRFLTEAWGSAAS